MKMLHELVNPSRLVSCHQWCGGTSVAFLWNWLIKKSEHTTYCHQTCSSFADELTKAKCNCFLWPSRRSSEWSNLPFRCHGRVWNPGLQVQLGNQAAFVTVGKPITITP